MYTIVICEKKTIQENSETLRSFLAKLSDDNHCFLEWNVDGKNIKDAVPGLLETAVKHKEWRALIVNTAETSGLDTICSKSKNPYDFFFNVSSNLKEVKEEKDIFNNAEEYSNGFNNIVNMPLVQLTNWITSQNVDDCNDRKNIIYVKNGEDQEEIVLELYNVRDNKDDFINKLLRIKKWTDLRDLYDNTIEYEDLLLDIDNRVKTIEREKCIEANFVSAHKKGDFFVNPEPKQVIVLSERALIENEEIHEEKIDITDQYKDFSTNNLFPPNTRFLISNVKYGLNGKRVEKNRLSFLSLVNVLATHEYEDDIIKPFRLYKIDAELDETIISQECNSFLAKLKATEEFVTKLIKKEKSYKVIPIDNQTAQDVFEKEVKLECKIDKFFDKSKLYCDNKWIGYAKNSPRPDKKIWDFEFDNSSKNLTRYLREPERCVKNVVKGSMREEGLFDDNRVYSLNTYQQEDVGYKLEEVKEDISEIDVDNFFDIDNYWKQINDKDAEINLNIIQRMDWKKIIISTIIILASFWIACMPFIVGDYIDTGDWEAPPYIIAIAQIMVVLVLSIVILINKHKLKTRINEYNKTIESILENVSDCLYAVSQYVSKTSSIMRLNSIISCFGKEKENRIRILEKHKKDIVMETKNILALFGNYIKDEDLKNQEKCEVFKYDFFDKKQYSYNMTIEENATKVEFLQKGNEVVLPVNYVKAIILDLEENYGRYY